MHHKFCVIELRAVIHGSYNCTNKAQWNKETISIDVGREIAEKFANEFMSLKKMRMEAIKEIIRPYSFSILIYAISITIILVIILLRQKSLKNKYIDWKRDVLNFHFIVVSGKEMMMNYY